MLNGGTDADSLDGGDGNDLYIVDNVGDVVVADSGGIDTVEASISYTLAAALENLGLTGTGDLDGTGNGTDNVIVGNDNNNVLTGLEGNDTLNGGAGDDMLDGGAGADDLDGGDGNDLYIVDRVADAVADSGGLDTVQS
jgi:Ca2+-binding RTX toxin-like protein